MLISARVHYAALAMLALAMRRDDPEPVTAAEITQHHGVPGPFLTQIMRSLRTAGWVESVRGSQGGYRLTVDPSQLSLLEIAEAIGCQEARIKTSDQGSRADEVLQHLWVQASASSRRVLSRTRLSDLVERCCHGEAEMFYI